MGNNSFPYAEASADSDIISVLFILETIKIPLVQ
jgi:hypothetical protein